MRKGISVGVVFAVAALAMALAGATSAAGPRPAKAAKYAGWSVVKQHGKRNYAGPNCPGKGWNCTTSNRVLQAAAPGGQNVAECVGAGAVSGGTLTNPTCNITQTGSSNVARCTQKSAEPSSSQSCVITQTGASNNATVAQSISSSTTSSQSGAQIAAVTQLSATSSNVVKVTQAISQSTKGTGGQTQEAHQKAKVDQTVSGGGTNLSNVTQSQLQKAMGGSPQNQNAASAADADCLTDPPDYPNACADINQHSVSGTNTNYLTQSIDQDANTAVSGASQQQGSSGGGLGGHVHQDTLSGRSFNKAKQDKHQKANGPANASQTQFDPVRCCGTASQFGGSGNVEDINQSSSIGASNPDANQHSLLIGESRNPDGTCMINQHAALDDDSANNSETLSPCPLVTVTTSCSSQSVDIAAVSRGDDNCFAPEADVGQVESALQKTVRNGDGGFDDSTSANTDDTVEFALAYDNAGDIDAHSVTLTDVVPAGLSFVDCSPEPVPCSYNPDNNTVTWNLGTVPFGQGSTVFFRANVVEETAGTTITNTANAASKEEGPGAATDTATVTVANPPDSDLQKLVRPFCFEGPCPGYDNSATINNGGEVEYQITYSNNGVGDAHNVTITDVLDDHHTFTAGSCGTSCSFDGDTNTVTWVLGTVPPTGANPVVLTFRATAGFQCGGSTGDVPNTASVTTTEEPAGTQSGTTHVAVLTGPC